MQNKYIVLIFLILVFLTVTFFAQEEKFTLEDKKASIIALKEAVAKLSVGMIDDNVYELMGDPMSTPTDLFGSAKINDLYSYGDGQILWLSFKGVELFGALNKDGFNLLSTDYTAKVVNFTVLINDKKMITSDPNVIINNKVYVPIECFAEQLEIKVSLDKDMQQKELPITGIEQMIEAVGKLNKGMTVDEVELQIGEPTYIYKSNLDRTYSFGNTETLKLLFLDGKLSSTLYYRDSSDLLSAKYVAAKVVVSPIFINNNELIVSNPIVFINSQVYVPVENFAEQLGIKVNFDEESQQLEITTK